MLRVLGADRVVLYIRKQSLRSSLETQATSDCVCTYGVGVRRDDPAAGGGLRAIPHRRSPQIRRKRRDKSDKRRKNKQQRAKSEQKSQYIPGRWRGPQWRRRSKRRAATSRSDHPQAICQNRRRHHKQRGRLRVDHGHTERVSVEITRAWTYAGVGRCAERVGGCLPRDQVDGLDPRRGRGVARQRDATTARRLSEKI